MAAGFCLEITESAIMDDPQRAEATLNRLAERGFKLSIDDAGRSRGGRWVQVCAVAGLLTGWLAWRAGKVSPQNPNCSAGRLPLISSARA